MQAEVYRPLSQVRRPVGLAMLVRTSGDPERLLPSIREAVWSVNPNVPLGQPQSMQQVVSQSVAQPRLVAGLIGTLAGLALLLGVVGTYAVLAADVTRRTKEIGVRMALGARRSDVVHLVLQDSLGLVFLGLALGLPAAGALSRLLSSQLFEVAATDPPTYLAVAMLFLVVGVLAAGVPARRAASIDPLRAIRHE